MQADTKAPVVLHKRETVRGFEEEEANSIYWTDTAAYYSGALSTLSLFLHATLSSIFD